MSKQLPLLLFGCGGHARACIDVIESEGRFRIAGLVGHVHEVGKSILGYQVLDSDEDLDRLGRFAEHALVAVGQIKSPKVRMGLFNRLIGGGWNLPAIVSPFARLSSHATIGDGTVVMHGAIVNAGAYVGRNCIVNSKALIEHDCNVGDHCHIATGAILNGAVELGAGSFIGSGVVVRQLTEFPKNTFVEMGEIVL